MTGSSGRHRGEVRRSGGPRHAAGALQLATRRSARRGTRQGTRSSAEGTGHRASSVSRLLGTAAVSSLVLGCALSGSAVAPVSGTAGVSSAAGAPSGAAAEEPSGSTSDVQAAALSVPDSAPDRTPVPSPAPAPGAAVPPATAPVAEPVAEPVAVSIPAIGVASSLVQLGLTADGSLQVPATAAQAGWFTGGPPPGAQGPAVIAGHVDSRQGPGVFFSLGRLVAGDEVVVARADGSDARFSVTATVRVPKDSFPADLVYGPVPGAELRLITCGGTFDRGIGHYRDNVVVFAALVPPATAA